MAKVVITIEDAEDDDVVLNVDFDPPFDNGGDVEETNAHFAAALAIEAITKAGRG